MFLNYTCEPRSTCIALLHVAKCDTAIAAKAGSRWAILVDRQPGHRLRLWSFRWKFSELQLLYQLGVHLTVVGRTVAPNQFASVTQQAQTAPTATRQSLGVAFAHRMHVEEEEASQPRHLKLTSGLRKSSLHLAINSAHRSTISALFLRLTLQTQANKHLEAQLLLCPGG